MVKKQIGDLNFYSFENLLKRREIKHFISTKPLDVGSTVNPKDNNRKLLEKALSKHLIFAHQVHNSKVVRVDSEDQEIPECDALITNVPNIYLAIVVADCAPMLLFDSVNKAIAVVHAGYKGTLKEISKETVRALISNFGSKPEDLLVGIGPCIGPCHYEKIDLWEVNKSQLMSIGVKEENMELVKICTFENTKDFYSERAEGSTGRFAVGITLI